jgi:hypothetical protein
MELKELLEKRFSEIVEITKILSTETSEYQFKNEQLITEIKASGDTQEDAEKNRVRAREMKLINSLAFIKSSEVQINIRVMNEIYSLMKFMDITPNISDKDLEILEFNLANVKPTFVLDKGKVVFFDKDSEQIMLEKLNQPDDKEDELVNKIKKFRVDGKS